MKPLQSLPVHVRTASVAALLVVPMLLLSACGGDDSPNPVPTSPAPQQSGPVTAEVSSCSAPLGNGQTTMLVAFRMPALDIPLHFKNAYGASAFAGSAPAHITSGTASPQPGSGPDELKLTGSAFDRIVFGHAKLEAGGEQTEQAPSLSALAGKAFQGPFGKARILDVRTHGDKVVVWISSPRTPAEKVENDGPQVATLRVGSQTLTSGRTSSAPRGSQFVNTLSFSGTSPMSGPATLTTSAWTVIDLAPLTVVLPSSC